MKLSMFVTRLAPWFLILPGELQSLTAVTCRATSRGADLLFQIVSQRYERGSLIVTTNKAYKHWAGIFNNDAGITAAILDRLLHRAQTVIEGKSYRMKDRLADEPAS